MNVDVLFRAATFSKDPLLWSNGFQPDKLYSGRGAYVFDEQGHALLEWTSSLGAVLLGRAHPAITERVKRQVDSGVAFPLPHYLEEQVANKLCQLLGVHVPGWSPDRLGCRFGKSGTDATTSAIRLARAFTGRQRILHSGYSGWNDWSISKTPPAWGIVHPQYVEDFRFNDIEQLEWLIDEGELIAAIMLEQSMEDPKAGYYDALRSMCDQIGALLILDEVVCGFRMALGGAAELYDIRPDLCTYAKGLANGFAVSAVVGHREVFKWALDRIDPVFISSTTFGAAHDLAAADAVLDLWDQQGVDYLWQIGQTLMDGLREAGYTVIGHPPRMLIQFPSLAHKTYFTLGMRDRNILWNRPTLPNLAHTLADVELTVKAAREIKAKMERVDVESLMADKLPMVLFEGR